MKDQLKIHGLQDCAEVSVKMMQAWGENIREIQVISTQDALIRAIVKRQIFKNIY